MCGSAGRTAAPVLLTLIPPDSKQRSLAERMPESQHFSPACFVSAPMRVPCGEERMGCAQEGYIWVFTLHLLQPHTYSNVSE